MSNNSFTWNCPPIFQGLDISQDRVASGISNDEAEMICDWALKRDTNLGNSRIAWDEDGVMYEVTEEAEEEAEEEHVSDIVSYISGWTFPIASSGGNDARWEQFIKGINDGYPHITAGGNRYAKKLMADISSRKKVIIYLQITSGQKISGNKLQAGLCALVEPDYEQLDINPIDKIRENSFYHEKFLHQNQTPEHSLFWFHPINHQQSEIVFLVFSILCT